VTDPFAELFYDEEDPEVVLNGDLLGMFIPAIDSSQTYLDWDAYKAWLSRDGVPTSLNPETRILTIKDYFSLSQSNEPRGYPYYCEYKNTWKKFTDLIVMADSFIDTVDDSTFEINSDWYAKVSGEIANRSNSESLYATDASGFLTNLTNPFIPGQEFQCTGPFGN
jgi:hypothetical protein